MYNFEEYFGKVDTPIKHVDWCIVQGRQMGKTQKLIYSIPKDQDVIIIVHNIAYASDLKKTIQRERPELNLKQIKFISYNIKDWRDKLRGFRCPVFVDNAVLDLIQFEFVRKLNETTLQI